MFFYLNRFEFGHFLYVVVDCDCSVLDHFGWWMSNDELRCFVVAIDMGTSFVCSALELAHDGDGLDLLGPDFLRGLVSFFKADWRNWQN